MKYSETGSLRLAAGVLTIFLASGIIACSGKGNVDLANAKKLSAEPIENTPTPNPPLNPLFSYPPGSTVSAKVISGGVDPVGTNLLQDFDGDGLTNDRETTTNIWTADFPQVEAQIAPPVTMKIQIFKNAEEKTDEISTDIASDDFESRKNQGSEKFHQNELAERTVQYETEVAKSSSSSSSTSSSNSSSNSSASASASASGFLGIGAKVSAEVNVSSTRSHTSNNSYNFNSGSSVRTQSFEDRPFKNNMDRSSGSVKSESAAKNARNYRKERRTKGGDSLVIKPDAGIVRAALYIKNNSVNMPVKLSNILASLVFETGKGELVPVQSFRLRNEDYSLFEIEVYGNSEFGPYVVELPNLNTVEVERAIQSGYTPKIFIVDYKMTHVADSNYRQALGGVFTGENLKIIEENAKGRTALVKLIAPNSRSMHRVAAFEVPMSSPQADICDFRNFDTSPTAVLKPGVSLKRVLERLRCSGTNIEFGHFVFDFSGTELPPPMPKVYVYGVKSINGRGTTVRCTSTMAGTGFDPSSPTGFGPVTACVIKMKELTQDEVFNLALWTVFDNGKFFDKSLFVKNTGGQILSFDGNSPEACLFEGTSSSSSSSSSTSTSSSSGGSAGACGIPVLQGVESTVWAGDNYDITYLNISDLIGAVRSFGTNPLETGAEMGFNTKWDQVTVGEHPFDPETHSTFLGKASLGDQLEITFNLKDTVFLNPNFGDDSDATSQLLFSSFTYNQQKTNKRFSIEEAIDFELSMGLGGSATDWQNVMRPLDPSGSTNENIEKVSTAIDYQNQKFKVVVRLPSFHHLVDPENGINVYLRPALSNAYRNTIWPEAAYRVKRYDSTVKVAPTSGQMIRINKGRGNIADVTPGVPLIGVRSDNTLISGIISSIGPLPDGTGYDISLSSGNLLSLKEANRVYVPADLSESNVSMRIDYTDAATNFFSAFNAQNPARVLLASNDAPVNCSVSFSPSKCYGYVSGYEHDFIMNNWLGNRAFENNWVDGSQFNNGTFMDRSWRPFIEGIASNQSGRLNLNIAKVEFTLKNETETYINSLNHGTPGNLETAAAEGKTLIVWQSEDNDTGDIWGRIVELTNGQPVGPDFLLSTSSQGKQEKVQLAAAGEKIYAVWLSPGPSGTKELRYRVINMKTAKPVSISDGLVVLPLHSVTDDLFSLTANIRGASVAYMYNNDGSKEIATASIGQTGACNIGLSSDAHVQVVPFSLRYTNTGCVLIFAGHLDGESAPGTRVYAAGCKTGNCTGQDFYFTSLSEIDSYPKTNLKIAIEGDRAAVVWLSGIGMVYGRIFDVNKGLSFWQQQGISYSGEQPLLPNVSVFNGKGLVTWWYGIPGHVRGSVLSLETATFGSAFSIGDGFHPGNKAPIQVSIHGRLAFVAYGIGGNILGRIVDLSTSTSQGSQFWINSETAGDQPRFSSVGGRLFVSWETDSQQDYAGKLYWVDPKYGLNNFFTAPLIERNYTATARIVK